MQPITAWYRTSRRARRHPSRRRAKREGLRARPGGARHDFGPEHSGPESPDKHHLLIS